MGNTELININLLIAGRSYPLKIKPSEEEIVRRAAKRVNEKVQEFQEQYAAKDKQDYLAMCALMSEVEVLAGKESAYLDTVALNAGAALFAAGRAGTIAEGVHVARKSIVSGETGRVFEAHRRAVGVLV